MLADIILHYKEDDEYAKKCVDVYLVHFTRFLVHKHKDDTEKDLCNCLNPFFMMINNAWETG